MTHHHSNEMPVHLRQRSFAVHKKLIGFAKHLEGLVAWR
jgi:hypothetical protein